MRSPRRFLRTMDLGYIDSEGHLFFQITEHHGQHRLVVRNRLGNGVVKQLPEDQTKRIQEAEQVISEIGQILPIEIKAQEGMA